jgi:hypothetical protein
MATSRIDQTGDHAETQNRRGRASLLSTELLKFVIYDFADASPILAAASSATGLTYCSIFPSGDVYFRSPPWTDPRA